MFVLGLAGMQEVAKHFFVAFDLNTLLYIQKAVVLFIYSKAQLLRVPVVDDWLFYGGELGAV